MTVTSQLHLYKWSCVKFGAEVKKVEEPSSFCCTASHCCCVRSRCPSSKIDFNASVLHKHNSNKVSLSHHSAETRYLTWSIKVTFCFTLTYWKWWWSWIGRAATRLPGRRPQPSLSYFFFYSCFSGEYISAVQWMPHAQHQCWCRQMWRQTSVQPGWRSCAHLRSSPRTFAHPRNCPAHIISKHWWSIPNWFVSYLN